MGRRMGSRPGQHGEQHQAKPPVCAQHDYRRTNSVESVNLLTCVQCGQSIVRDTVAGVQFDRLIPMTPGTGARSAVRDLQTRE